MTRAFTVHGTVQGAGFRPFVHRLADGPGLSGWVANVDGHVEGEVTGPDAVTEFGRGIRADAPPLARVRGVVLREPDGTRRVCVRSPPTRRPATPVRASSSRRRTGATGIRSSTAPTRASGRHHRGPAIRPRADDDAPFPPVRRLCRGVRRPPRPALPRRTRGVSGVRPDPHIGDSRGEQALKAAVGSLATSGIVAVKGLGGYQSVCDATDPEAVAELRRRKRRPVKPFAVMVRVAGGPARLKQHRAGAPDADPRPLRRLRGDRRRPASAHRAPRPRSGPRTSAPQSPRTRAARWRGRADEAHLHAPGTCPHDGPWSSPCPASRCSAITPT